jgi:hypothetical protein
MMLQDAFSDYKSLYAAVRLLAVQVDANEKKLIPAKELPDS